MSNNPSPEPSTTPGSPELPDTSGTVEDDKAAKIAAAKKRVGIMIYEYKTTLTN